MNHGNFRSRWSDWRRAYCSALQIFRQFMRTVDVKEPARKDSERFLWVLQEWKQPARVRLPHSAFSSSTGNGTVSGEPEHQQERSLHF